MTASKFVDESMKDKSQGILDVWLTGTALSDESGRPTEIVTTQRNLAWLTEK
jgi:hypothetical protein